MRWTAGIVLFEGMEELDFAGPYEVFAAAAALREGAETVSLGEGGAMVRGAKGLRVAPDHGFDDAPPLDVLVVPGGDGRRRESKNPSMLDFLKRAAPRCRFVTSVCTGSFVLHAAGLLAGRRVTTHWSRIDELRALPDVTVVTGVRFVRDEAVVTAAGVSAGIDMALWVVGQLEDPAFAREVARYIEYDPAPPYTAET